LIDAGSRVTSGICVVVANWFFRVMFMFSLL